MGGSPDPPFEMTYKKLLDSVMDSVQKNLSVVEECELPLIDLKQLGLGEVERQACKKLIVEASQEWGFFQVINHGVSPEVVGSLREEQMKLFKKPFEEKKAYKDLNFSAGSYRWGTPSPTSLHQLSWSEAFHVQLSDILGSHALTSLRYMPTEKSKTTLYWFWFEYWRMMKELFGINIAAQAWSSSR